jgi:glutamyl-tRNA synthetase
VLVLRNDDLDSARVRAEFVAAMFEDMQWLGIQWQEGPNVGGPHFPYTQSERLPIYREVFQRLKAGGFLFACACSRKDVLAAVGAPHTGEDEPIYPGTCRMSREQDSTVNWRFRVPDGESVEFSDENLGMQRATAGVDFGDFLVWRKDDVPSYQLACAVDDASMGITEVVRGGDLVSSTFRQLLLLRALGVAEPSYFHCPLVLDETGRRLAKRDSSTTIRGLRASGATPEECRAGCGESRKQF